MNFSARFRLLAARVGIGFLSATAIGIFFAAQIRVASTAKGHAVSWAQALYWSLGDWYEWALLAPPIFWLARRFSFGRARWPLSLAAQLLAGVAFATVHAAMCAGAAVLQASYQGAPAHFAAEFRRLMANRFPFNLAVFAMLVAGWHAWNYYRESRDRATQATELAAQLAEARLHALRMQLNPHFLFNTLNSISSLMLKDVYAANQMLARLGEFLRRTLETANEAEIPLRRELDFARQYLDIEQVRFGPRLSVAFRVEPALLDAAVPNLILQPLVENAIRHGVERTPQPNRLEVNVTRDNGSLQLRLTNSAGAGLEDGSRAAFAEGVGLSNTLHRLRQLYGDAHQFNLATNDAGGATVSITIPFRSLAPAIPQKH
jgi:two-component system LytT family sensor kinase